jgi:predicted nucleotidyltransferase
MLVCRSPDPEQLRERLRPIFGTRPEVLAAFVFGSSARGAAGPSSDVDIAVLLSAGAARLHRADDYKARLLADLMSSLGTSAIDLVLLNEAPPLLSHRVLRDGLLLHVTDERALADFRFRATKPLREARTAALRERLARGAFATTG